MISAIACTNRPSFLSNIIENFNRQTISDKELILVFNCSTIEPEYAEYILSSHQIKFKILLFPEAITLGECLNHGIQQATYPILAKFDDDDYYGPHYLKEAVDVLQKTNAEVIGKSTFYVYFDHLQELRLYHPGYENAWIGSDGFHYLHGASLIIKRRIWEKIPFSQVNVGEDTLFQKQCFSMKLPMYSTSKLHFAYKRYTLPNHHTSDMKDQLLIKKSIFIKKTASLFGHID
ncbi:MAG: glycosyltransferase [Bacillota bacterium]|nr:glycosyltransferase [Bacillota bacterium]